MGLCQIPGGGGRVLSNYYEILNIARTAESVVIRAAYRTLISKYHPDTWRGDPVDAEHKSKLINEAYSVLRNEHRRAAYDQELRGCNLLMRTPDPPGLPRRFDRIRQLRVYRSGLAVIALAIGITAAVLILQRFTFFFVSQKLVVGPSGTSLKRPIRVRVQTLGSFDPNATIYPRGSTLLSDTATHVGVSSDAGAVPPSGSAEDSRLGIVSLQEEDRFTIQLSCASAVDAESAAFRTCVDRYLEEVIAGSKYPLGGLALPTEMITQIELNCAEYRMSGPEVYNGCLKSLLKNLTSKRQLPTEAEK